MRKVASLFAFVSCVLLAAASDVRADYSVTVSESGFVTQTFTGLTSGGASNTVTGTIGEYTFTITTNDTAPGISAALNSFKLTQNTLTATTASTPTADLAIAVQATSFDATKLQLLVPVMNSLYTTDIDAGTLTAVAFY